MGVQTILRFHRAFFRVGVAANGWAVSSTELWLHIGPTHHEDFSCFSVTLFWFTISAGWLKGGKE